MTLPTLFTPGATIFYRSGRQYRSAYVLDLYVGVYPTPENPKADRWYVRIEDHWDGEVRVFAADILADALDVGP